MMTNGIRQNAATRKNVLVQSEIIIFDLDENIMGNEANTRSQ